MLRLRFRITKGKGTQKREKNKVCFEFFSASAE